MTHAPVPSPQVAADARRLGWGRLATLALTIAAGSASAAGSPWYLQTGGVSHHFQETQAANRQWREQHPGLGVEYRSAAEDGWSTRWAGGLLQDSRNYWGGYAGMAYLHEWRFGRDVEVSAGAGAYAFYRSTSWSGRMALVPAVLPTVSVGLMDNRLGFNLIYVPRLSAMKESMPAVLHAQMVFRFQ